MSRSSSPAARPLEPGDGHRWNFSAAVGRRALAAAGAARAPAGRPARRGAGRERCGHRRSASRKARTCRRSTSGAMKLLPMPRARMKVSAPRVTFLSCAIQLEQPVRRPAARPGMSAMRRRQADGLGDARRRARRPSGAQRLRPRREAEGQRHADRHAPRHGRAAPVVAGSGLQRVAEGVAEIEQRAVAGLVLVARDDVGLGRRSWWRSPRCAPGRRRTRRASSRSSQAKNGGVVDQPVFGDLGIAGAELAQRQRVEHVGVGEHQARLVEGADQVLAVAAC